MQGEPAGPLPLRLLTADFQPPKTAVARMQAYECRRLGQAPLRPPGRRVLQDEAATVGHSRAPGPGRWTRVQPTERSEDGQAPGQPSAPTRNTTSQTWCAGLRDAGTGRALAAGAVWRASQPVPRPPSLARPSSEVNSGQTRRPQWAALTCRSPWMGERDRPPRSSATDPAGCGGGAALRVARHGAA